MRREFNLETGQEISLPDAPPTDPTPPDFSAIDATNLNAALAQDGSVFRALAELTLIEINKLRADHARQPYTKAQFIAALKAQMRT